MTVKAMNIPLRTVVYAALVVVLSVVFVLQETITPERNTIPVPTLADTVDRLVVSGDSGPIELVRSNQDWLVGDQEYPADAAVVEGLLETLRGLSSAEVISGRGNHQDYGLTEDQWRQIRVFDGDIEPVALQLGDRAAAGGGVYGRINRSREVVLLPGAILDAAPADPAAYRRTQMARLEVDTIVEVEFRLADAPPWSITREDASDTWVSSDGREIEDGRFQNLFTELSALRAQGFPETDPTGEPLVEILVRRADDAPVTIRLWPPKEDRNLPATVTGSPYPFYVPEWRARRLVLGQLDF